MVLVWGGYSVGLWGWCLIRDYDLTFSQLVHPAHPYAGTWPPQPIPSTQIWPGGTGPAAQQQAAASAPKPQAQQEGVIEKIIRYLGTPKFP